MQQAIHPSATRASAVHPSTEIRRLMVEIEDFDREIADLSTRIARKNDPFDRIMLGVTQTARWATDQALDAWPFRLALSLPAETPPS